MYLELPTENYSNQWAGFMLTDTDGKCFQVGMARYIELTSLQGIALPQGGAVVYLSVIDHDLDRLKLANRMLGEMLKRGMPARQWDIQEMVRSWSHGNRRYGKPVTCIETGEQWPSLTNCVDAHKISYSALQKHLNGQIGYRTVKGRTYRRAG